jgi:UDP-2,4-diacetamido-2,4,6-trideoxy-beta-L-altropyranose hydrolase
MIKIRVDANQQIGVGHLMRCISIAEILKQESIKSTFYLIKKDNSADRLLKHYKAKTCILDNQEDFFQHLSANDTVILDGYDFPVEYEREVKNRVKKLITIDDQNNRHYISDVIINHAPGVKASSYSCEPYTKVFTGLSFCLLRQEFLKAPRRTTIPNKLKTGLLCFGGADIHNKTEEILNRVAKECPKIKFNIIVGPAYVHMKSIRKFLKAHPSHRLFVNIRASKLVNLIQQSDFAIVSSSTISLECLVLGTPLFIIKTASNQKFNHAYLLRKKAAAVFKEYRNYSKERGAQMLAAQQALINGSVTENIKNAILH